MSRYWSNVVTGVQPYVPGEQPKLDNLIKLNTNENPYPPSPAVITAIQQEVNASLRLYPDPNAEHLTQTIADYHGVDRSRVFVGNGSDEVLAHAFYGLLKHEQPILFPDITYSFYPVYCGLYGVEYRTVAVDETFGIRVEDYDQPNGGIIFPNPNAPTGRLLPLTEIERLVAANPASVVVIDEAYIDFGGQSAIPLTTRYDNLLVIQTLSKSRSLAGLRVGFAIGHPDLIEALDRIKNSFNSYPLDRLAIIGAAASFGDQSYFEQTCRAIIATRASLSQALQSIGFEVLPSAANFLFARHPAHDAGQLAAHLRERHVVVRHFKTSRIEQFLRISIGTDAECQMLVSALGEIIPRSE